MKSKLVIFVIISTLLVLAAYSSTTYFGYALTGSVTTCQYNKDKTQAYCIVVDTDDKTSSSWKCEKNPDGKTWHCWQAAAGKEAIPPALSAELDASIGDSKNTTKVPKSDLLNDGGILKGQDGNQTTSQALGDRFCKEGTGGETGNKCIPCDPGLKFEVGCIDVLTGGPLDMQTAPSESGKSNDTNPKDLGGLNNDDNGPQLNPGE